MYDLFDYCSHSMDLLEVGLNENITHLIQLLLLLDGSLSIFLYTIRKRFESSGIKTISPSFFNHIKHHLILAVIVLKLHSW